jgi:hypothetical protein
MRTHGLAALAAAAGLTVALAGASARRQPAVPQPPQPALPQPALPRLPPPRGSTNIAPPPTRGSPAARSADAAAVAYDGRFTFARIRFEPLGGGASFWGGEDPKWDHDFPRAERNFARILAEVTAIRPFMDGGTVLALDDPELFKFPVAYLCEPGFWSPTDREAAALRAYLTKGGFIIFDDFFGAHWDNFEASMRRVLPQARLVRLDASHPIFDAFYHIPDPAAGASPYGRRRPPEFYGIFEDNDPGRRLLAIANYNNDVGEDWEWSDTGQLPVDVTNHAYKLGVNYVVYGMTH